MTPLTISNEYNVVWVASQWNLLPSQFDLLDWDEQERLIAYSIVKQKIEAYYQWIQDEYWKTKKGDT